MIPSARTHNNANAYEHSGTHLLEFFSKAGSLYKNKGSYYGEESTALELFKSAWFTGEHYKCMQLLFWLRDIRGGSGSRSGFGEIIKWLAVNDYKWISANIHLIPEHGRWSDLYELYGTEAEMDAIRLWSDALLSEDPSVYGLAAKWADRNDKKLAKHMFGNDRKAFRKLLVSKTDVVETKMCENAWSEINYNHVPSVATARYAKAFEKHDKARYDKWRLELGEGKGKVNAGSVMPHDIVRTFKSMAHEGKDAELNALLEAMFNAMPNYMEGTDYRILPVVDFSGSMNSANVSGSITAYDVAFGLGLYCGFKLGESNPFYKRMIPFSETAKLECWKDMPLVQAMKNIPNHYCGSTDIHAALMVILDSAKFFNATNDQIPNVLLVLSDMQFDQGGVECETPIEEALIAWADAGYSMPKIIYWNLAGYKNQPTTADSTDVAMVSGFSAGTLKAVLGAKDFSPMSVLEEALKKYEVVQPSLF